MKRILIFIVAYEAERHIASVLRRIPDAVWQAEDYRADCVVIDDASTDATREAAQQAAQELGHPVRVLRTPSNQGYGGNQKLGYRYALAHGYDGVVLLHGDGQYAPECLPQMIAPLIAGEAEVVFGSRMMEQKNALRGGMPYYKFIGNRVLSFLQNRLLGLCLSEFHSGYRAYAASALRRIPFIRNSNGFSFDTDIIIQLSLCRIPIREIPIPTYYGDEVCRVNGVKYAVAILKASLQSALMRRGLFYTRKFDIEGEGSPVYRDKTGFCSSHSFAINEVVPGARVLDIGDMPSHVARALKAKGCEVHGMDRFPPADPAVFASFTQGDLAPIDDPDRLPQGPFDAVLLLDVIEHMPEPERTMDMLWRYCTRYDTPLILTTPNIAFFSMRLMLLCGWFQYGKAGILDRTHTRLFTFRSARHLVSYAGFRIVRSDGIPAPFPLALADAAWAARLLRINRFLIRLSRGLFSYQIAMVLHPRPDVAQVFEETVNS